MRGRFDCRLQADCNSLSSALCNLPLAQGRSPGCPFLQDLLPRAAFSIHRPSPESVVPKDVVGRDDKLEIPSRVGGLQLAMVAATARRMRETDASAAIEHQK